jgi:hypothetical protein
VPAWHDMGEPLPSFDTYSDAILSILVLSILFDWPNVTVASLPPSLMVSKFQLLL